MRKYRVRSAWLPVAIVSTFLTLAVTSVAWAHVVVSPENVPADSFEKLTVSVPTEKEIPTTEVRVEVPEGFTVFGVQPVPGWDYELEEDGGVITEIPWSGGEIRPQEFQEFVVQTETPEKSGSFSWKAFQTYEDGSVVEWAGPPAAEEPASVVEVVSGGARAGESGPAGQSAGSGFTTVAAYGGLVLGALALVVALRRRKAV